VSSYVKKIVLHTCSTFGLFRVARFLTRKKLLILCYHGFSIQDESRFRPKLFINKETFSRRMSLIERNGHPVLPLGEALQKLHNGTLPDNAVVITIDDGFYSVLDVAADILANRRYPATLYLTTYYVDKETPIFRLIVQYMFWRTTKVQIDLSECSWTDAGLVTISDNTIREKLVWTCIRHGEKHCSEPERIAISRQLGEILDVDYETLIDSRALSLLTREEAARLDNRDIDIQLHTHRHYFPSDNELQARREIRENRKVIEQIVDHGVEHFCYPSGLWSEVQWPWLASMNVTSATTCLSGFNDANTPLLGLKRFLDGENISEIEFSGELSGFLPLARAILRKH
jgi:peptidoglycan/xylan/chitin deacetylase (PgdA/CDA1 family)